MNELRLAFLLHTLNGLQLSSEETAFVLRSQAMNARELADELRESPLVDGYLSAHRDWYSESRVLLEKSRERGVNWVMFGEEDYPELWYQLSCSPIVFSYQGEPVWKTVNLMAVVGSRTPMTETRFWMQRELGHFLKLNAIGVVSGGARGVDQWAHRLALDYDRPTVCIFPAGLSNPYPFGQEKLWRRIVEQRGALVSTFGFFDPLRKRAFHVRNRWIAGMARTCLVVEANRRSGSTLTAELARDEGRDVCTIPVFPLGEQGLANLDLIRDGAIMIRDHRDLTALTLRPSLLKSADREPQKESVH
jgi:DNA processing protein